MGKKKLCGHLLALLPSLVMYEIQKCPEQHLDVCTLNKLTDDFLRFLPLIRTIYWERLQINWVICDVQFSLFI